MASGDVDIRITTNRAFPCLFANGTSTQSVCTTAYDFLTTGGNFTISYWVKNIAKATDQAVFAQFLDATNEMLIGFRATGKVTCAMHNGTSYVGSKRFQTANTDGVWYHVVYINNAGTFSLYVNGVAASESDNIGRPGGAAGTATFMQTNARAANLIAHKMGLKDFRVYDVSLTATEVADLYAGKNVTRGLYSYFPLISDYTDTIGNKTITASGSSLSFGTHEDAVLTSLKAQFVIGGESGKYFIATGKQPTGQVISAEIEA